MGKELFILFAASAFRKLSSIYVFSYFPFGFEGRIWDLILSVPDHCLSFYFANVCPLFKKSDRSLACDYRPVSLTCVPCKLLEHIVCSNIMVHLDEYKLLSDRHHAFRKGYSCETQLTMVINDWAKILDNRGQVDTFIWDFEKAFDTPLMSSLKVNCLAMESVAKH